MNLKVVDQLQDQPCIHLQPQWRSSTTSGPAPTRHTFKELHRSPGQIGISSKLTSRLLNSNTKNLLTCYGSGMIRSWGVSALRRLVVLLSNVAS